MADISKIKIGNNSYDIKDTVARQMITGGLSFNIVWTVTDFQSNVAPTDAKLATIPQGVVVQYHNGASGYEATGTLTPEDQNNVPRAGFYLVYRRLDGNTSRFDEYVVVTVGSGEQKTYLWERIGNTSLDLKGLVTDVSLAAETTAVYGTSNTFTNSTSSVTAQSGTGATATVWTGVTKDTMGLTPVDVIASAVGSVSLTGTTSFNTDAMKAEYVSNTETLQLSNATKASVDVSTTDSTHTASVIAPIAETTEAFTLLSDVTPTTDTVIKTLPTLTAAAQTISVGGTNKSVLDSSTTINVQKHS